MKNATGMIVDTLNAEVKKILAMSIISAPCVDSLKPQHLAGLNNYSKSQKYVPILGHGFPSLKF